MKVCACACLSVCLSVCLFCLSVCSSVCSSVRLFCLSVLSVWDAQHPLHYSQNTANTLGLASTGGCLVGLIICGYLADVLHRVKGILVALSLVSGVFFAWFTLVVNHTIQPSEWQLCVPCAAYPHAPPTPTPLPAPCPSLLW
jgi:hypothetical protein